MPLIPWNKPQSLSQRTIIRTDDHHRAAETAQTKKKRKEKVAIWPSPSRR